MQIHSVVKNVGRIELPTFGADQLYMAPIDVSKRELPAGYGRWQETVSAMLDQVPMNEGIVYLTIDEKELTPGNSHRRGGAHIDGVWIPSISAHSDPGRHVIRAGRWDTGPGWIRASNGGGLVLLSNAEGCKAWSGTFNGVPGEGGDLEHIRDQLDETEATVLVRNNAYLLNVWGVHESIPVNAPVQRSLVRLTLPETVIVPQ